MSNIPRVFRLIGNKIIRLRLLITKIDELVKSQKAPSPLMGEGRGEGENNAISASYVGEFVISTGRRNLVFSACYVGKISRFARNDMLLRLFTRPSKLRGQNSHSVS